MAMRAIASIRSERDYKEALREVSSYFKSEPAPGSEEGNRFEMLMSLVEDYEASELSGANTSAKLLERRAPLPPGEGVG